MRKKGKSFKNIHSLFPSILAKLSKEYNLEHFIHISALVLIMQWSQIMQKVN